MLLFFSAQIQSYHMPYEYGYREARKETDKAGVPVIYFPKQAVLYLEEGKGVPDELKLRIKFPVTDRGEQEIVYKVVNFVAGVTKLIKAN